MMWKKLYKFSIHDENNFSLLAFVGGPVHEVPTNFFFQTKYISRAFL